MVSPLPGIPADATDRRRDRLASRWAGRGIAALAVSAVAHAMVMASAGVVLCAVTSPEPPAVDAMDIDIGPADVIPEQAPSPGVAGAATTADRARPPNPSLRRAPSSRVRPSADAVMTATTTANVAVARFVLSTSTGTTAATGDGAAAASLLAVPSPGRRSVSDVDPVGEGDVNVPARLMASVPVVYPPPARRAEIEVDLPMEIVVGVDGRVRAARGLTQVGYDLDQAALKSIGAYRFYPALRDGRPVPVRMRWTVQFRLR